MPPETDFFRYMAATPEAESWGLVVTGAGCFTARPRRPYPPTGHPKDHQFTWALGRRLGSFQVVYLSHGCGECAFADEGIQTVSAGDALLIRPGVWHRYRPQLQTGWTEHWVELAGSIVTHLLRSGPLDFPETVLRITRRLEFEDRLANIRRLVTTTPCGRASELAAQGIGLLALLDVSRHEPARQHPMSEAIAQAQRAMEESDGRDISMPDLARSLGVAYSNFRREFRRRTGISPRQYLLRVRMQHAQRLLGSTDETLKQISDQLGFSSPFHLSTAFKAKFGVSPSKWRQGQTRRS